MHKKLFLVFPGQGSQHNYMLSKNDLLPIAKSSTYKESLECLSELLSENAINLIESDSKKINATSITQPLVLYVSYLHYQKLIDNYPNIKVDSMSGHSLGEYTALTCSNALDICDSLKLVRKRGELMENSENGSMSAILGIKSEDVIKICKEISSSSDGSVNAANLNSPIQTVISGNTEEVKMAEIKLKELGALRAIRLNVSVAAHSDLMRDPAQKFKSILQNVNFKEPVFKIYQNVTASITREINIIKENLIKQLYMPVKWSSTMKNVTPEHYLIEVGPSKVLAGLCKANGVKKFSYTSINNYSDLFIDP